MNQASFLSLAHSKKLKCESFLDEMGGAIPWNKYIELLRPYYKKTGLVGRDRKELELMLKIYFLQQWYNLSDPGAEEAIYDRISFQKFLGIDLLGQTVPDETTILNFRHYLATRDILMTSLKSNIGRMASIGVYWTKVRETENYHHRRRREI